MAENSRYDVLFEPVRIGPVTAPNRFYQVPHASGMTNALPRVRAAFREAKAEGGWGVVCTGACSIAPSSDDSPLPFATLWDDADIRAHALMTEAVHRHGALAGVELWHGGAATMNRTSRLPPLSPSGIPLDGDAYRLHGQSEAEDHGQVGHPRRAALAGRGGAPGALRRLRHRLCLCRDGLSRLRVPAARVQSPYRRVRRLDREPRAASCARCWRRPRRRSAPIAASRCASAWRSCAAAPAAHAESEAHEAIALLSDLPDLFDVKMDSSPTDCAPSRFAPEGSHEPVIDFVKTLTDRPVVGVGRFTSPDTMVSQVRRGILDLIGGARPSIADPFLPAQDPRRPRPTRSANASAATSASRAGTTACRCAARRTRRPARSGGAAGIPNASPRPSAASACWWSAAGRPAWNAR